MFECIQAILTADMANMASIEYQSNMSLNQLHGLETSQNHNFQGAFQCPQFPKLRLLRRQNFLRIFLPSVPLGSACGLGPRALGLPRPNTAACGRRMGPRFGGRTAPRGQGRHGGGEQHEPWPRAKDLGRENPLEALRQWDPCEEMDELLMVQVCWWMLFSSFLDQH